MTVDFDMTVALGGDVQHIESMGESMEESMGVQMALQGTQHGIGGVEGEWEESRCLQIPLHVVACCINSLPRHGSEFRSPVQEDVGVRRHGRPPCSMRRRLRKNGNWTNDQLKRTLEAVDKGQSMKKAAEANNIPYTSFRDHCLGKTRSRCCGVKGVLTPDEEAEIVQYLIRMCDLGFGLTPSTLKMKVFEIMQHHWTPFRDGILGDGWMRWFRRRHPELTLRGFQGLESAQARALGRENVQTLYDNLERMYTA